MADWPNDPPSDTLASGPPPGSAVLRSMVTGEELTTPALTVAWPDGCEPIVPSEMPSDGGVGPYIRTLEDGVRWARFGNGDDLAVESIGPGPGELPTEPVIPVSIRGHEGSLFHASPWWWPAGLLRDLSAGVSTIQWEEGACSYRIQLPALTAERAIEYASRF